MNETLAFGNNLSFVTAQIINLIFVILLITLPIIIWRWFSKREKERKQQLNRIEKRLHQIDNQTEATKD